MSLIRESLLKKLRANTITGRDFCAAYSKDMDKLLKEKAAEFLTEDMAIVATGGYGRAELCPASDIDVVFLVPKKTTQKLEKSIEKILYYFWDSGVKIGYSVRSVADCIRIMGEDSKVMTSLMDARHIWGNKDLYEELTTAIQKAYNRRQTFSFVQSKLRERDERHKRFGDTRYVLEPNIKDGKGGLRDLQTLFWITGMVYGAHTPDDLERLKILSRRERKQIEKAHDFLLTVRCQLHEIAERGEERLHFDIQTQLAKRLGYTNRNTGKAVERFMKHYFLVCRDIGDLTRIICAAIEQEEDTKNRLLKPTPKSYMGFEIEGERLSFSENHDLEQQPLEIFRFFRIAQETGRDIHPKALRRITRKLDIIDNKLLNNPLANRIFLEILTAPENAGLILRRMNEAGVLERFIPDFRRIIALMQFDRYHVFTVDEHTLRAIDILHKIENGDLREHAPLASALIQDISERRVLFVAMLLHDICKGRGGDHSLLGAELALKLCPRLGLTDHETRLVSWLVFDHLFMSDIAFKRDLDDPKTLDDFLFRIHGLERLKLLTILTTADIMAVGPERWTAWKDKLIQDLYYMAEARILGKHPMISTASLTTVPSDLGADETRIEIEQDTEKNVTIVHIYTHDRAGLFSTLAGALAAAGTNIIEARISTLDDGRVADIFTVQNLSGKAVTAARRIEDIKTSIHNALAGTLDIKAGIAKHQSKPKKKDQAFDVPADVLVKNKASRRHTVLEIYGRDRPGLLYDLARTLHDHKTDIVSAKINTLGLKAIDVFYLQNAQGKKIEDEKSLEQLCAALKKQLSQ